MCDCDFETKPSLRLDSQILKSLYLSYSTPASPIECPQLVQIGAFGHI
jgi:hypothetical protein